MPYIYAILALIVLVVLHELGHFLAAKIVGIRATKFYVFFPPAIFKRKIGDVEYGVGSIPAGGFVKLPGMFEPDAGEIAERLHAEIESLGTNISAASRLRLDAHRRDIAHSSSSDQLVAPLRDVRSLIEQYLRSAETDENLAVKLKRCDNWAESTLDDLHPKAYWRAALWRRMSVIFAGPLVNLLIAFLVLTAFYWLLVPRYEISSPLRIDDVSEHSPAALVGLTNKDRITNWNGPIVGVEPSDLMRRISDMRGEPMHLEWIDENKERHSATITPRKFDGSDEKELIGVSAAFGAGKKKLDVDIVGRERSTLGLGTKSALIEIKTITVDTFTRLPRVFFDSEVRESVGSVVGIVQVADDVDKAGQFIRYLALISLVLAVMNLLPLLPLDGGHILFGALEALRRRPMPRASFERYSMLGLALVLVLFAIGLNNDISRIGG